MTRPSKKEHERRLARNFLEGFIVHTSLDDDEQPDFRVRRGAKGDIALEVTEYHSQTPVDATGRSRIVAEVTWWRHLLPNVNSERRTRPSLKDIKTYFRFGDGHLPGRSQSEVVARELVGVVQAVVADRQFRGSEVTVAFEPRAQIQAVGGYQDDGVVILPTEDWPNIAGRLEMLLVSRHWHEWPFWECHNATTSVVAPDVTEFKRIFENKTEDAKNYNLCGLPLWLLIACDMLDDGGEAHSDLASHIFPRNEVDADQLADVLRQTGFDFQTGPFSQVWLFSCFTGERRRLYPPG